MRVASVITYDGLPTSSGGGHVLRTRSPVDAWGQVKSFLSACTDARGPADSSIEIVAGEGIPRGFSDPLEKDLTERHGRGTQRVFGAPDTVYEWPIEASQVEYYVDLIQQLTPLPVHQLRWQPISVNSLYKFSWLSTEQVLLPNQNADCYLHFKPSYGQVLGESHLYARISERSSVSVFLNFPFLEPSDAFARQARFVQRHLPFQFSSKHWKRWRLTKSGNSYVGRKIPAPK